MAESKKKEEAKATESGEKLVSIRLPLTKEHKEDVFVRVNHRTFLIQRGVTVEVPACVAEVLKHSEDAMLAAMEYENKV